MLLQFFRITTLTVLFVSASYAATLPAGFVETPITGLSDPTAMEIAPDGRIFVCEQGGNLRVIKNGVLLPAPFMTLNVDPSGERGLLGIAFDPNFAHADFDDVFDPSHELRHGQRLRFRGLGFGKQVVHGGSMRGGDSVAKAGNAVLAGLPDARIGRRCV